MELTAIKVKIGLNNKGGAMYPNFNVMSIVKASGKDWSNYIDQDGLGWHYDKTSGHREETVDSPVGQQFGMLVIPELFADQAVAMFPSECTRLTEVECEAFYNDKAHAHEPDDNHDDIVITGLKDTLNLMERTGAAQAETDKLKAKIRKALDPADKEPGIKKNMRKKWADFKGTVNVTIKNPV